MKNKTQHHYVKINGVEIFYREAGPADAPTLVLLHGYPTSCPTCTATLSWNFQINTI